MNAGPYYFRGFYVQAHLVDALQDYVKHGIPTGDFLRCVIENDLKEACGRADGVNIAQLPAFVAYMVNEMPAPSQGSPARYLAWVAHQGLDGADNMPKLPSRWKRGVVYTDESAWLRAEREGGGS